MNNIHLQHLSKQHPSPSLSSPLGLGIGLEKKLKKKKHRFKTRLKGKEIVIQNKSGVVKRAKISKDINCNAAYRLKRNYRGNKFLFPTLSLKGKKRALQEKGVIGENLYKKERKEIYQNLKNHFSKKRVVFFFSDKYKEKALLCTRSTQSKRKKTIFHDKKNATTIHVLGTYNNTIYTLSPSPGKTGFCISTGMCGFKNSRKSTSFASQKAAEKLSTLAKKYTNVRIKMRGLGPGKVGGVRTLYKSGLKIRNIQESTPLPHNGCRPPKRRRL